MAQAIEFPGVNVVFAKDQPEYLPLPAMVLEDGNAITCWKLSPEEIEKIQKTGCIFLSQLTFKQPLQPVRIVTDLSDLTEFITEG